MSSSSRISIGRASRGRAHHSDRRARSARSWVPRAQLAYGHHHASGSGFLQIQPAFAEMERNIIRQRVREGVKAARARGRKGGRPRIMTPEKLHYAQSLMADRNRSNPDTCRELGGISTCTIYHCLHANGTLKEPGRRLLSPLARIGPRSSARDDRSHGTSRISADNPDRKLVNWNVEWATPRSKRSVEIINRIDRHSPEFVCLTETHIGLLHDALTTTTQRLDRHERLPNA